ncbi:MAG TPA: xanthine dehydrogenase family protein subunit M [Candidatus Acidoferrales bacterium]|nr:xanthine dehydrogenase family protein subunit M [Candidatus Acidoferrales bacterium]
MQAFELLQPTDTREALKLIAETKGAAVIAGGTNIVDLMKCGVASPSTLVDITRLPLNSIESNAKRIRLGALASNSDVAYHSGVVEHFPMLSQAFLAGASPQLRNMATVGGNVLQRTRCPYFRDPAAACNKRHEGDGCDAFEGLHRMHAILGTSDACIATHPSDAAVALVALDAILEIHGPSGARRISLEEFYALPGETPSIENDLKPDELIAAIEIPLGRAHRHSTYLKVRDRASYEFALVSVAAGLDFDGDRIGAARIALGGVGTIPWRVRGAEEALVGTTGDSAFKDAADIALKHAVPRRDNAFKVELAKRAIVRALETVRLGQ